MIGSWIRSYSIHISESDTSWTDSMVRTLIGVALLYLVWKYSIGKATMRGPSWVQDANKPLSSEKAELGLKDPRNWSLRQPGWWLIRTMKLLSRRFLIVTYSCYGQGDLEHDAHAYNQKASVMSSDGLHDLFQNHLHTEYVKGKLRLAVICTQKSGSRQPTIQVLEINLVLKRGSMVG